MNDAHFHLVVNHLPIVGVLIGFLVLLVGLITKASQVKITALGIFLFSGIAAIGAYYTGEGAEDIVENMSGISETLIHDHEEFAERFLTFILILGSTAVMTFFLELKKLKFAKYGFLLVLILSIISIGLAKYVGTSGGEIRHTEIRTENALIQIDSAKDHDDD